MAILDRTERVELTVLCLLREDDRILLQNRVKDDWRGYAMPGGHVEPGESIVDAVIREMQEETGLTVIAPKLCGVKQFPIDGGRYLVFLFCADRYTGQLRSSDEGSVEWISRDKLFAINTVSDFLQMLSVFEDDGLTEFQYLVNGDDWQVVLK